MPHPSAQDAADYLIWLAAHECEDDPDYLTPLKLQKLLYYVQGWALAEWGRPFFRERLEAWRDGPVVPEVYRRFKGRERLPIVPPENGAPPTLGEAERALVRGVWDAYKRHSGWTLRDMTHAERPYADAFVPDDRGRGHGEITPQAIERSFKGRAEAAVARLAANRDRLRRVAAENTKRLAGRDAF